MIESLAPMHATPHKLPPLWARLGTAAALPGAIILAITMGGCQGPEDGVSSLVSVSDEAAGANCATGGQRIESGADDNDDGVLGASEVESTSYLCNGAGGALGLLTITDEPAGMNCAAGGKKIESGTDDNDNGMLDAAEIDITEYVCDGADGDNGTAGTAGAAGADGADPAFSTEVVDGMGVDCPGVGGILVSYGPDTDGDDMLDPGEIVDDFLVCNGDEGAMGAMGTMGSGGGSSIIPVSSGQPVTVTTVSGGLAGPPAFIGFGSSVVHDTPLGGTIDLTGSSSDDFAFAFTVPRAGTITSVSAFHSLTTALSLVGTTVSLTAQLYASTTPDNTFTPVAGTNVSLTPSLTGVVGIGTISTNSATGLSVPVTAGTRLLFVVSATAAGVSLVNSINGYASGAITIE